MNSRAGTDGLGRKSSANRFVEEELVVRTRAGERMLELESRNPVISAAAGLAGSRDAETGCHLERIRHYRKIPAEYPARSEPAPGGGSVFHRKYHSCHPTLHYTVGIGTPAPVLLKADRLNDRGVLPDEAVTLSSCVGRVHRRDPEDVGLVDEYDPSEFFAE